MSNTKIFENYYENNFWGNKDGSSGPNSARDLTPVLRKNLAKLFDEYKIDSILDAGCGDANLFKYIDIDWLSYIGVDCVASMIKANQQYFAKQDNMQFCYGDVTSCELPQADIIICRDVVHYLPNDLIFDFLNNCIKSESKYLLVTHNLFSNSSANCITDLGIFRPVNLTLAPFKLPVPIEIISEDVYGKAMALWRLEDVKEKR